MEKTNNKTGAELILEERQRQIEQEGFTKEHDDNHNYSDLIRASLAYALSADGCYNLAREWWPWEPSGFKPTTPERDLIKSGALSAAAYDRLVKSKK